MDKLRECPFCGATPKIIKGFGGIHGIQCGCGAVVSFKLRELKEKAIVAWNKRHDEDKIERDELVDVVTCEHCINHVDMNYHFCRKLRIECQMIAIFTVNMAKGVLKNDTAR